jgi:hypothetical protein
VKRSAPRDSTVKPAPAALSDVRFDFRAAARKAVKDHPEIKKNTVFVDAANDDYIAAPRVLEALEDDDDAREELEQTVRTAKRLKTSFSDTIALDSKRSLKSVVFHQDRHPLYDATNRAIDDIGTFDHETGHVLSPETDGTLSENTADAYAVIRHVQRFDGTETGIGYTSWKRTVQFILAGKTSHLTTFTVDKILMDRESADFVSLSPAATAKIAKEYARLHTPDEARLKKLSRAFRGARDKKLNEETFRRIAGITLRADAQSDTFYLGARALLGPLENGNKIVYNGKTVSLKSDDWARIKSALTKKIAALPDSHPLKSPHLPPALRPA